MVYFAGKPVPHGGQKEYHRVNIGGGPYQSPHCGLGLDGVFFDEPLLHGTNKRGEPKPFLGTELMGYFSWKREGYGMYIFNYAHKAEKIKLKRMKQNTHRGKKRRRTSQVRLLIPN